MAYASTTNGVEGETSTATDLLLDDTSDAAGLYVGLTRGRHSNVVHIVADDVDHASEQWIEAASRNRADLGIDQARDAAAAEAANYRQEPVADGQEPVTAARRPRRSLPGKSARAAGVVPLLIGPRGGVIAGVPVNRTYANAASIEFDALVLCGELPPAPDAVVSGDAKAVFLPPSPTPAFSNWSAKPGATPKRSGQRKEAPPWLRQAWTPTTLACSSARPPNWEPQSSNCWLSTAAGIGSLPAPTYSGLGRDARFHRQKPSWGLAGQSPNEKHLRDLEREPDVEPVLAK